MPILHLELRHSDLPERLQVKPSSEDLVMKKDLPEQKSVEKLQQKRPQVSAEKTGERPSPEAVEGEDQHIVRTVIREPAPLTLAPENDDAIPVRGRKTFEISKSMDMSPSAQADLQKMNFAGHVYSEERDRRMIMINNKILREGDGIDTDFRLDEITRNGVVLLYHSTRIPIDLF